MKVSASAPTTPARSTTARYSTLLLSAASPLEFVCMAGQMIPGFDAAVKEMEVGETKNVHLPASEAYGEHDEQLVQTIPTAQIPWRRRPPRWPAHLPSGPWRTAHPCRLLRLPTKSVTFDLNHEMAGKDLNFEITLVEVVE